MVFERDRADKLLQLRSTLADGLRQIADAESDAHAALAHATPAEPTSESIAINGLRAHLILLTQTTVEILNDVVELLLDTETGRDLGIE